MTFPMQNLFQAELEYEKDFERMRELYPREVAKIVAIISDRCDELEFEGSRIYDENPDRMMMEKEAHALYEKIKKELGATPSFSAQELTQPSEESESARDVFSLLPPSDWSVLEKTDVCVGPDCEGETVPPYGCDDWLCGLVGVLFPDEIYKRRCRYRRSRRWW
jgi:hypothetical protein